MDLGQKFTMDEILLVALNARKAENFSEDFLTPENSEDEGPESTKNFIASEGFTLYLQRLGKNNSYLTHEGKIHLSKIWKQSDTLWDRFRFIGWKLLSGTNANVEIYKEAYNDINDGLKGMLLSTQKLIELDVRRTQSKELTDDRKQIMNRVLLNLAKRRMDMGYCQGINFICAFFIDCGFSEHETFWLMVYLFEHVNQSFYYRELTSAVTDVKLLWCLIRLSDPELASFMSSKSIDLTILVLPMFITFFTTSTNFELKKIIMDHIFFEGITGFFKILLVFFDLLKPYLLRTKEMLQFKNCFDCKLNEFKDFALLRKCVSEKFIHKTVFLKIREVFINSEIELVPNWPGKSREISRCVPGMPYCFFNEPVIEDHFLPQVFSVHDLLEGIIVNYFSEQEHLPSVVEQKTNFASKFSRKLFTGSLLLPISGSLISDRSYVPKATEKGSNVDLGVYLKSDQQVKNLPVDSIKEKSGSRKKICIDEKLLLFRTHHHCILQERHTRDQKLDCEVKHAFFKQCQIGHSGATEIWSKNADLSRRSMTPPPSLRSSLLNPIESFFDNLAVIEPIELRRSKSEYSHSRVGDLDKVVETRVNRLPKTKKKWVLEVDSSLSLINQHVPERIDDLLFEHTTED